MRGQATGQQKCDAKKTRCAHRGYLETRQPRSRSSPVAFSLFNTVRCVHVRCVHVPPRSSRGHARP
jgi:hypothetical protein